MNMVFTLIPIFSIAFTKSISFSFLIENLLQSFNTSSEEDSIPTSTYLNPAEYNLLAICKFKLLRWVSIPNFIFKSEKLTEGLEEQIEDWIKETPDARLVVIDTYVRALPTKNKRTFSLTRRASLHLDSAEQKPKGSVADIISQSVVTALDSLALAAVVPA